jgi:hypothetical protein
MSLEPEFWSSESLLYLPEPLQYGSRNGDCCSDNHNRQTTHSSNVSNWGSLSGNDQPEEEFNHVGQAISEDDAEEATRSLSTSPYSILTPPEPDTYGEQDFFGISRDMQLPDQELHQVPQETSSAEHYRDAVENNILLQETG